MATGIFKADTIKEFYTEERCFITEVMNDQENPESSVALVRVEPGVTTAWHSLDQVTEKYLVISGLGLMEVADIEPTKISTGDVVVIPAGCRQRVTNLADHDLTFYAVCTPRFTPECYRHLE